MKLKKKLLKKHLEVFWNNICDLKSLIKDGNDFIYKLSELNKSYRCLQTVLERVEYKTVSITEEEEKEFVRYKNNNNEIIYSNKYGILSVEMGNEGLNKFIFDRLKSKEVTKEKIVHVLNLYSNCTESNCMICGFFVLNSDLIIPYYKLQEDGEILSFHWSCFTKQLN